MTKFNHKYLVAATILVALIIVNQSVIQYMLYTKQYNAEVINVGGKQRMLSQRLKSILLKDHFNLPGSSQSAQEIFSELETAHVKLSGLTLDYSAELKDGLNSVGLKIESIKPLIFNENDLDKSDLIHLDKVLDEFLYEMNDLVNGYENYSQYKLKAIIFTELIMAFITLLVIISQTVFVFIPLSKKLLYKNMALQANIDEIHKSKKVQEDLVNILSHKVQQSNEVNKIISYNVRPPIINLGQLLEMYKAETNEMVKEKVFEKIQSVSSSLGEVAEKLKDRFLALQDEEIKVEPLELEEVIKDAMQFYEDDILSLNAKIELDLKWNEVEFYRPYLRSALVNLIGNSLKFSSPDSPIEIYVSSTIENDRPVLKVRDNGLGIDLKKYGHKIFELGQRFHPHIKGTGFDLFMTRSQLKSLGARISMESEPDGFTEVKIVFNPK